MGIKEFAEEIKAALEERLENEVRIGEVTKNNGVKLHALTVVDKDINITPTIYLEHFFKRYEEGAGLGDVAECIYNAYMRDKVNERVDMSWLRDFEQVREKVAYKLINCEKNKELLKQIPHTKLLDLAKVYYVVVETEELGRGTILIHNNHIEIWNVEPEQLEEIAVKNTLELLPAVIDTMENVLMKMLNLGESDFEDCEAFPNMYIISNPTRIFGAATLCYPDAIRDFASKVGADIIILPSSVHEIILMKREKDMGYTYFKDLVYEINRTQVDCDEVLSDSVYIYHRDTDSITIV